MTFKTQTLLLNPTFLHCTELCFSSHYIPSGGPGVRHVHDAPHAGLHLVPPPDHPRGNTASVPALATGGQQLPRPGWRNTRESRSFLRTCSYREKSFWISFWKSFSLISDFSPCRTASKSWYLQLELQKHYRTFCTSFAQSEIKIKVFSEYWRCKKRNSRPGLWAAGNFLAWYFPVLTLCLQLRTNLSLNLVLACLQASGYHHLTQLCLPHSLHSTTSLSLANWGINI